MAYYAKLTEDNLVLTVLRFNEENENIAIETLTAITNWPLWKKADQRSQAGIYLNETLTGPDADQTKVFRATFPAAKYHYDPINDIFHEPKPYPSWILNISTGKYDAPIQKPQPDNVIWNENTLSWDIISN